MDFDDVAFDSIIFGESRRENMNQVIILLSRYSDDNSDMIKDCIIFRKNLLFSKMERILKGECIICQKKSWGR